MIGLLVQGVARVISIKREGDRLIVSADDLRGAIRFYDDPEATVAETHNEKEMLASILDLGDLPVGEIMIHRRQDDHGRCRPAAHRDPGPGHHQTRTPGCQCGRAIPTTSSACFMPRIRADACPHVPDSTTLHDQLHAFRQRHAHFALVIDEYGTIQGLVTLVDILDKIVDEHDITVEGLEHQVDGGTLADGRPSRSATSTA